MRTHYGPWQPCWISNQHQKQKSGRGPSSEHFWQVWLKSVQRFQGRRFKCEKLTDGRRTLTHDKRGKRSFCNRFSNLCLKTSRITQNKYTYSTILIYHTIRYIEVMVLNITCNNISILSLFCLFSL